MLTPQEIQNKKFEKAVFGGYDMSQIDDFLDEVLVQRLTAVAAILKFVLWKNSSAWFRCRQRPLPMRQKSNSC